VFGAAGSIFGVWLASTYQDWLPAGHAVLLGLGVAIAAPVGDLFESFIKRDAGTKDTGRLFGAHGGALDRLDAVLFTIVAGYYVWAALH
jgi:phosphatidate cytidylyltransferase